MAGGRFFGADLLPRLPSDYRDEGGTKGVRPNPLFVVGPAVGPTELAP